MGLSGSISLIFFCCKIDNQTGYRKGQHPKPDTRNYLVVCIRHGDPASAFPGSLGFALPDARLGEEIMAWIKVKPGEQVTAEELQAFCKGQIAHYKVPRYFKFVDAFPMTVTGKIQKFQMRQQSTEELGLQSAASIETA